jgi:hypothetical protein
MRSFSRRAWSVTAVGAAVGAALSLAAAGGPALAAHVAARPATGSSLISNGQFSVPGPAKAEGATPAGWQLVDLGAETKPFSASIGAYDAKGKFAPPAGDPDKNGIADNVFYEAGSATGVEGIGGQQSAFKVPAITQANNPQVRLADVEVTGPATSVAAWAGSGLEIDFTSGGASDSLIYLNPWTPPAGSYAGAPVDTATTKYIFGKTLTPKTWNAQLAWSLNTRIRQQFGLTSYTVSDIRFINLEDATSAGSPFPNMNGYVADISVVEGPAKS